MRSQFLKRFLKRWNVFHPRFESFLPTSCPGCVLASRLPERMEAKTLKVLPEGGSLNLAEAGIRRTRKMNGGFRGPCLWWRCWDAGLPGLHAMGGKGTRALLIHSFHPCSQSFYQVQALGQLRAMKMMCPSVQPLRVQCLEELGQELYFGGWKSHTHTHIHTHTHTHTGSFLKIFFYVDLF